MGFFEAVIGLLFAAFLLVMVILVSVGIYAVVKTELEFGKERKAKKNVDD